MNKTKTIAHLFYIPMTGLGLHNGYRGDVWLKNRLEIFKKYVLNALCNQSNLSFTLVISWRPEDRNNPIVIDFERHMNQIRAMSPVFTYDGLIFWDDKFPDEEAGERLYNNLRRTLPKLKQHVDHADEVLLTCQPSDDMYLADAVKIIQETDFEGKKAIGWEKGYMINYATKEIANYDCDTLPPFSTIRFPKDIFLDPEKHMEWAPYKSHEFVKDLGFKALQGRKFVVGTHNGNISTVWNHPYKGRVLSKEEQEKVLLETGTFFTEPIIQSPMLSRRLLLRKLFNLIPGNGIIRNIYHVIQRQKETF